MVALPSLSVRRPSTNGADDDSPWCRGSDTMFSPMISCICSDAEKHLAGPFVRIPSDFRVARLGSLKYLYRHYCISSRLMICDEFSQEHVTVNGLGSRTIIGLKRGSSWLTTLSCSVEAYGTVTCRCNTHTNTQAKVIEDWTLQPR
jgi:hypothetical protein